MQGSGFGGEKNPADLRLLRAQATQGLWTWILEAKILCPLICPQKDRGHLSS